MPPRMKAFSTSSPIRYTKYTSDAKCRYPWYIPK